jgi:hypothetical protein
MRMILLVAALAVGCGNDEPIDPGPDAAAPVECASSTEADTAPAWQACRAVNVDSWPLVCGEGEVRPPCAFDARTADGEAVICRPAGACE